ncbi:MAG: diguanylate cyclase [Chloroflexi bacterium]|nr:diguanylate cyclase [Chloroflexota bacterium]
MRDLPLRGRVYLIACYLLGLGALGAFVLGFFQPIPPAGEWLLGAGLLVLAAAAQIFVVERSGGHHSDHLTPAPLFAAFLLLPNPLLAMVVVLTFLPEWILYRRKWFIQLFNIASWLVATLVGRSTLFLLSGHGRLAEEYHISALSVLIAMPLFLGVQTVLLATALKLARGHSYRETGLFAPGKLFVELALLCLGWAFALAWRAEPLAGIAAAIPLVTIFQALHVPNLREEAATDPKTGLANMRHFNMVLVRDLERADRSGQPVGLLMCDLDYLRNINNTYGHQAGDAVLQGVADAIRRNIRGCDVAARFGGEEFVILLVDTDRAGAEVVAERLRRQLEETRFGAGPRAGSISATMSIGVAAFPRDGHTPETLIHEADLAVYKAKREGRNRVALAGQASRELTAEWAQEHLLPASVSPNGGRADGEMPLLRFISDLTRWSTDTSRLANRPEKRVAEPAAAGGREGPRGDDRRPDLALPVAVFIATIVSAGLLGIFLGLSPYLPLATVPWGMLAIFAGVTILAEQLAVDISGRGKTSVGVVSILGATFLAGGLGMLVTTLAFALWAKLKARSPLYRMFFNFGNALLAAEGASLIFRAFVDRPVREAPFEQMIIPAAVAGLVYYAVNHLLLCLVRGLAEGRRPWEVWSADYSWLWPYYAVFGALGLTLAVGYAILGWAGILALVSPVAMMQLAIKQYMDRTTAHVNELRRLNWQLSDSYEAILLALVRALDTRDEETEAHSQRVKRYTELIARRYGLPEEEIEQIARGALLHDIGKIGVPDAILLKPGQLTPAERAHIRNHPTFGYSMIAHIPFLAPAAQIVLYHHEGYDGSGYPAGLSGDRIPVGARIFAVADAFDAMTSDRPYRKALSCTAALDEIARCRGSQFDPQVVDALLSIPADELIAVRQREGPVAEQRNGVIRRAFERAAS